MPDETSNLPAVVPAETPIKLTRADLDEAAERIRLRERTVREAAFAYLENGRELSAIKAQLGHGNFIEWCKTSFEGSLGWSVRTIERLMLAADFLGEKIDSVSKLGIPKTTVYAVSAMSTPEPIRQEFLSRIEAGDDLRGWHVMRDIKAARTPAKLPDRTRDAREKRDAVRARKDQRIQERLEAAQRENDAALDEAAAILGDRLGDEAVTFLALLERAEPHSRLAMRLADIITDPHRSAAAA